MSAVELAEKRCSRCERVLPLSQFYRDKSMRDGHASQCKECNKRAVSAWQERKRAEMGDEAWRARNREQVRRARQNPAVKERGRRSVRARAAALERLRERHEREFGVLLEIERRRLGL